MQFLFLLLIYLPFLHLCECDSPLSKFKFSRFWSSWELPVLIFPSLHFHFLSVCPFHRHLFIYLLLVITSLSSVSIHWWCPYMAPKFSIPQQLAAWFQIPKPHHQSNLVCPLVFSVSYITNYYYTSLINPLSLTESQDFSSIVRLLLLLWKDERKKSRLK